MTNVANQVLITSNLSHEDDGVVVFTTAQIYSTNSTQVQTQLTACRRFAMVRIPDNGPGWEKDENVFCRSNIPQK